MGSVSASVLTWVLSLAAEMGIAARCHCCHSDCRYSGSVRVAEPVSVAKALLHPQPRRHPRPQNIQAFPSMF